MPSEPRVPEFFSKARACAISGYSRPTVDKWISSGLLQLHGAFKQVSRTELEALIGRPITLDLWDQATVTLNRQALARSETGVFA